jgi:hypothetical protein
LCDMPSTVAETHTKEGKQLAGMVVRHMVVCYRRADPEFSLAPTLDSASEEVEATTKEDLEVDVAVTKVVPRL